MPCDTAPKENHEMLYCELAIAADVFAVASFFFTRVVFFHFVIWISHVHSRTQKTECQLFLKQLLSVEEIEKQAQKQMLRNVCILWCRVIVFVSVCERVAWSAIR